MRKYFLWTIAVCGIVVCFAFVVLGAAWDSMTFLILGMIGAIAYGLLIRFPVLSLMFIVHGFYYYPLAFEFLGLNTSSITTIGFWSLFSSTGLIGYLRQRLNHITFHIYNPCILLFVAFFSWNVASWALVSNFSEPATQRISFAFFMMAAPFLIGLLMEPRQIRTFFKILIIFGVLGSLIAVFRYISGDFSQTSRYSISEFSGSLQFVYAISISLLCLLSLAFEKRQIRLWILVAFQYLLVYFLVFAASSRGALIILTIATILLLILSGAWQDRLRLVIALAPVVFVMPIFLPFISFSATERFGDLFNWLINFELNLNSDSLWDATGGRAQIWAYSFGYWKNAPWIGIGIAEIETTLIGTFVHNFILETLVELGLVGSLIFTLFFGVTGKYALVLYKVKENAFENRTALIVYLFSIMTMLFSGRLQTHGLFWLSCGLISSLAVAASRYDSQEVSVDDSDALQPNLDEQDSIIQKPELSIASVR